jgi:nicotinate-nucleotide adenylyltransferase
MKSRILFGGAFDPVHIAHLALAEYVSQEIIDSEFYFMPAARSPFKTGHRATYEQRCQMLELAIKGSDFQLDRREANRSGPAYTIDSLLEIRQEFKAELFLLIGQDNLPSFHKWKDHRKILDLATLLVINRPETNMEINTVDIPRRALNWPGMDVSSSWLRKRMKSDFSCKYLLPPGVWNYIQHEGLYVS